MFSTQTSLASNGTAGSASTHVSPMATPQSTPRADAAAAAQLLRDVAPCSDAGGAYHGPPGAQGAAAAEAQQRLWAAATAASGPGERCLAS